MCAYCGISTTDYGDHKQCSLCKKHFCYFHQKQDKHHCEAIDWAAERKHDQELRKNEYEENKRLFEELKSDARKREVIHEIGSFFIVAVFIVIIAAVGYAMISGAAKANALERAMNKAGEMGQAIVTLSIPIYNVTNIEGKIHERINIERQNYGLSVLSYDPKLADIARNHSMDMGVRNFFEHDNPDGLGPVERAHKVGYQCSKDVSSRQIGLTTTITSIIGPSENIFEISGSLPSNPDAVADTVVRGWMNSPGHRANILQPVFDTEGIGVYIQGSQILVTQNLC